MILKEIIKKANLISNRVVIEETNCIQLLYKNRLTMLLDNDWFFNSTKIIGSYYDHFYSCLSRLFSNNHYVVVNAEIIKYDPNLMDIYLHSELMDIVALYYRIMELPNISKYLFDISQYILLPLYSFVRLFVYSFDVIHTLGIYSWGVKIDAIPLKFINYLLFNG